MEFEIGGVGEGVEEGAGEEKVETRKQKAEWRKSKAGWRPEGRRYVDEQEPRSEDRPLQPKA